MNQDEDLIDDLRDEISSLRAELATLRTIGFNDLARHEAEVATVQAHATTYWDALADLVELGEEALSVRPDNDNDRKIRDEYRIRLISGRAALGMKPTT